MAEDISREQIEKVLRALSNSDFKWRTLVGVAQESGLTQDLVQRAIAKAADKVIRAAVPSADGQDLFTTRDNFRKSASLSQKLLGAIKNRAV